MNTLQRNYVAKSFFIFIVDVILTIAYFLVHTDLLKESILLIDNFLVFFLLLYYYIRCNPYMDKNFCEKNLDSFFGLKSGLKEAFLVIIPISVVMFIVDVRLALKFMFTLFFVSFGEESLYRGVIYYYLKIEIGSMKAIIISSILFGLVHLPRTYLLSITYYYVLGAFLFGLLMSLTNLTVEKLTKKYSIWPSILFHASYNFIINKI